MAYRGMGSRIHRDVSEEVKGVVRFGQTAFPFQQLPISDANRIEREVLHKGDVGMHVLERFDEREVRMRWSLCCRMMLMGILRGMRWKASRYFNPGKRGCDIIGDGLDWIVDRYVLL
jgi:hypothetical protein